MEREWGEFQAGARRGRIAVPPVFEISAPFRAVPNFHAREIPQPRIFPRSVLLQVNEISTLHACKKAVDASLLVFSSPCLCFEQVIGHNLNICDAILSQSSPSYRKL